MRMVVFALIVPSLLLTACERNLNTPEGQKSFTPQPVLSPPASDINSIGHYYAVPPAPKTTTPTQ